MWFLHLLGSKETVYILRENQQYTVGRTDCSLNFTNDKSVSRCHCALKLSRNEQGEHLCFVKDSSRFGTEVDDSRITNSSAYAKAGAKIRFGAAQSVVTLSDDSLRTYPATSEIHLALNQSETLISNLANCIETNVATAQYYVVDQIDEALLQSSEFLSALVRVQRLVRVAYFHQLFATYEQAKETPSFIEAPDYRCFSPTFGGRLASFASDEAGHTTMLPKRCLLPDERRASLFSGATFHFVSQMVMRQWRTVLELGGATCRCLFDSDDEQLLRRLTDATSERVVYDDEASTLTNAESRRLERVLAALRDAHLRTIEPIEIAFAMLLCDVSVFTNAQAGSHDWLQACSTLRVTTRLPSAALSQSNKRKANDDAAGADDLHSPNAKRARPALSGDAQTGVDESTNAIQSSPLLVSRKRALYRAQAATNRDDSQRSVSTVQSLVGIAQAPRSNSTAISKQRIEAKTSNASVNLQEAWLSRDSAGAAVSAASLHAQTLLPASMAKSQSSKRSGDPRNETISDQLSFSKIMHVLNESTDFIASKCAPRGDDRPSASQHVSVETSPCENSSVPQRSMSGKSNVAVKVEYVEADRELPEAAVEAIDMDLSASYITDIESERSRSTRQTESNAAVNFKRFRKIWPTNCSALSSFTTSLPSGLSEPEQVWRFVDVYAGTNDDAQLLAEFAEAEERRRCEMERGASSSYQQPKKSALPASNNQNNSRACNQTDQEGEQIASSAASSRSKKPALVSGCQDADTQDLPPPTSQQQLSNAAPKKIETRRQKRPGTFGWFEDQLSL